MKYCPLCSAEFSDEHATCPHDGVRLIRSQEWAAGSIVKGKYRILSKLGQGGMGLVYKAEHILMGKQRALKVMNADLARDPSFLRRFRQEAQAASELIHPNIVRVDDLDQAEDGSLFIAMEFVEGASLRKLLQEAKGPLPVARALGIARGMAEALALAHAHGMVHRDIKPDNVLVARDPRRGQEIAKVLDFGIVAMRESSAQLSSMVVQTDAYASPEQWMGMRSNEIDARADLYSLGMTLYEMLAGRLPFDAHTRHGWMRAHLDEPPAPPSAFHPALPPAVDELVLRLLAKNRDERTPSAEAFLEELKQVEAAPAAESASGLAPTVAPTVPPARKTPEGPGVPSRLEPPRAPTPPPKPPPPKAPAPSRPPAQESVPLTIPPKRQEEPPDEDLYAEPEAEEVIEEPVVIEAPPVEEKKRTPEQRRALRYRIAAAVGGGVIILGAWLSYVFGVRPTVNYLTVSPPSVEDGQPVRVAWSVSHANSVTLRFKNSPDVFGYSPQDEDEKEITPDVSGLIGLSSYNKAGSSFRYATVEVRAKPATGAILYSENFDGAKTWVESLVPPCQAFYRDLAYVIRNTAQAQACQKSLPRFLFPGWRLSFTAIPVINSKITTSFGMAIAEFEGPKIGKRTLLFTITDGGRYDLYQLGTDRKWQSLDSGQTRGHPGRNEIFAEWTNDQIRIGANGLWLTKASAMGIPLFSVYLRVDTPGAEVLFDNIEMRSLPPAAPNSAGSGPARQ
jgi:serine/threonine protein kinase